MGHPKEPPEIPPSPTNQTKLHSKARFASGRETPKHPNVFIFKAALKTQTGNQKQQKKSEGQ